MFEEFIGNKGTVEKIDNWFRTKYSKSIVIQGQPGNGKTFLVELFAKKYDYYLERIDPYDINNINDFNNIIKTLNLIPLECEQTEKIILVENIDEFHSNYRKKLFDIKLCKYPVIYTGTKISLPEQYRKKIPIFRINKPAPTYILEFLKRKIRQLNIEIDDEILDKISKQSPSIRSALNSLYNANPNNTTNPIPTLYEQLNNVKYHVLNENVNRKLLHYLFGNVGDYKTISLFAKYDIELGKRFKSELDKYLFNERDFNFVSNEYPEFMNKFINGNNNQYMLYTKDLHVSSRIVKKEFSELIEKIDKGGGEKQEDNKKNKSIKKGKNILDFV